MAEWEKGTIGGKLENGTAGNEPPTTRVGAIANQASDRGSANGEAVTFSTGNVFENSTEMEPPLPSAGDF